MSTVNPDKVAEALGGEPAQTENAPTPFGALLKSRFAGSYKEPAQEAAPAEEAPAAPAAMTPEQINKMIEERVAERIAASQAPAPKQEENAPQAVVYPKINPAHFEEKYEDVEIHNLAKVADFALQRLEEQDKLIAELREGQGSVKSTTNAMQQQVAEEKTAQAMVNAWQDLSKEAGVDIPWDEFTALIVPNAELIRTQFKLGPMTPFTKESILWGVKTAIANENPAKSGYNQNNGAVNSPPGVKRTAPRTPSGSAGRSNGPGDTLAGIKELLSQED